MDKPRIITLCCGAGLGEDGLKMHFRAVAAVDSWWRALCSHIANHPAVRVFRGDITNWTLIASVKNHFGTVDGVVATPPCPPFSSAGQHDPNDPRAAVFLAVTKWVAVLLPTFVIVENVEGLKNSPYLLIVLERLRFLGYEPRVWLLDAANFGVPQRRKRLFVVAVRDGIAAPEIPLATHGAPGKPPFKTLRDAIGDLTEDAALRLGCAPLSKTRAEILAAVPPGGDWRSLTGWQATAVVESCHGRKPPARLCRRYAWDETPNTILTGPHVCRKTMPLPPHVTRPFSVVEYLRLQGVTREFRLFGNVKQRYAMIGNAVPVQMMAAVAGAVAAALQKAGSKSEFSCAPDVA